MNRKKQQAELIYKVGLALKPLIDVIEQPDRFDSQERAQIRARFHVEHQELINELNLFCKGEQGAEYSAEMHDIQGPLVRIFNLTRKKLVSNPEEMRSELDQHRQELIEAIATIPVAVDSAIYEARTPFTTYGRIKELCETTRSKLVYVDRYVDYTIFHRFLGYIPHHVGITIITWPRSKHNNTREHDNFIDISRLYASERPTSYRLMTEPNFHDRWLRCDDQLFHLGGSVKDAASKTLYTIAKMDSTSENLQQVDDLINKAKELFGPSSPSHP